MARFSIIAVATTILLPTATMAFSTTTSSSSFRTSNTALFSKNAQDPTRTAPAWTQPTYTAPPAATATIEEDDVPGIPEQTNLWTNVLDTPVGQKARELPDWAKSS